MRLVSMAGKRAATAAVAAIVAGTAAATLGATATPALADVSSTLSCSAAGSEAFPVPITVTGKISGTEHHPGDTVTLDGVSVTSTISEGLAGAIATVLPAGTTDVTVSGAYQIDVTGESDDPNGPSDGESLTIPMQSAPFAPDGFDLASDTVSTTKKYDVGPAGATFGFFLDGFGAALTLSGTGSDGQPVEQSLDVQCTPANDGDIVIDAVNVTEKQTPPPPGNGGTGTGGNGGTGGTDKNGNTNTGGNGNNNTGNTGTNTGNTNTNTGGTSTQGRGTLANTGAPYTIPMTAVGGALVLLGAGTLVAMRRRGVAVGSVENVEG